MSANLLKLKALLHTYATLDIAEKDTYEIQHISDYTEVILQSLLWDLQHDVKEDNAEFVIPKLQEQLTQLADTVSLLCFNSVVGEETHRITELLLSGIFQTLQYLEQQYSQVFNYDAALPANFVQLARYNDNHLRRLEELVSGSQIDQELAVLLMQFFTSDSQSYRFKINSWRQWLYRESLLITITDHLEHHSEKDQTLDILKMLVGFELNSIQFYAYWIKYIEQITISDTSLPEQQQELLYLIKVVRQVRTEVPVGFSSESPSLKSSVIECLDAELSYITEKEKVYLQSFKTYNAENSTKFYFRAALTLAELMFFFRVALETGMMSTKFNSYLYEFISKHIQTQRAENISKKSMRNHFNNKPFPDRIVLSVRHWMEKMIEHIDLTYKI